jgi:hypothetical protein
VPTGSLSCDAPAQQADALVEMARAYLAGGGQRRAGGSDHYPVVVHVGEAALRDQDRKSDLPVETVRRLSCDGRIGTIVDGADGAPLKLGRRRRVAHPLLKRSLVARDRRCCYPGCTHEHWLDAHHVMHWGRRRRDEPR